MGLSLTDNAPARQGLTTLLQGIHRELPVEIMDIIWSFLPSCPTRSLLFVAARMSQCSKQAANCKPPVYGSALLDQLVIIYHTRFMGSDYICGLDDGKRLLGYASQDSRTIKLPPSIRIVKFIVSTYGITKLCFLEQWRPSSNRELSHQGKGHTG